MRRRRRLPRILSNAATGVLPSQRPHARWRHAILGLTLDAVALVVSIAPLAAASLWVRSYARTDAFYQGESWVVRDRGAPQWHTSTRWIVSDAGRLTVWELTGFLADAVSGSMPERKPASPLDWKWTRDAPRRDDFPRTTWTRLGLAWTTLEEGDGRSYHWNTRVAIVPYWLPTGLFACLAVPSTRRIVRRWCHRPWSAGCCPACGYDLRATPARCPECGAVPPPPPPPA